MNWQSEFRASAVALAAVFCLGSIGYRVLTAPEIPDLAPSVSKLNAALASIPDAARHVSGTSDAATGLLRAASPAVTAAQTAITLTSHRINDLCPPPTATGDAVRPCGTLADANRTLATLRGTSGQVERSLLTFNQHESDLFAQEAVSYAGMTKAVTDFDALVADPDLRATIHNGATITGDTAAMTTDGRNWLHAKLYPTKRKGFISGFEGAGDVAKHWMPPLF